MPSTLLTAASPIEARAILAALNADPARADRDWHLHPLTSDLSLLITGIGKVNAAGALARFADPAQHTAIISLGIAGALPDTQLEITDAILATSSVYADEGLETPDAFLDCAAMGFPLLPAATSSHFPPDPHLFENLKPLAARTGPIATISTCSGTDKLARQVQQRTGALAECMEGAAIAHIARRLNIPFAELRIISNTTGNRPAQTWDIKAALAALTHITGRLPMIIS